MAVIYGGLTAEQWNEISWFLGPSQNVTTVNGLRIPRNHYPMDRWGAIEDRIDSALSSANGILNTILSPVRSFVRDVLHPVINIADKALGFAYDLIHLLLEDAVNLAYDAGNVIIGARDWAITVARSLVDTAQTVLTDALHNTANFLGAVIDTVRREAGQLVDGAINFAKQVEADVASYARTIVANAQSFLSGVIDTVRRDATNWFNDAKAIAAQGLSDVRQWAETGFGAVEHLVQHAYDDLRQWATTAIKALGDGLYDIYHFIRYDILDPLVGKVEDLIGAAGKDFAGLMHVLADAAEWLIFVTTHVIPEIKAAVEWALDHDDVTYESIANAAIRLIV